MAAFLTALANIGNQAGTGYVGAQEEKAKLAQQQTEQQMALTRLGQEQAAQKLAEQRFQWEKGRYQQPIEMKMPDGSVQWWLPDKGHFGSQEEMKALGLDYKPGQRPDPMTTMETALSYVNPKIRERAKGMATSLYQQNPNATPEQLEALSKYAIDWAEKQQDREDAATEKAETKKQELADKRDQHREDMRQKEAEWWEHTREHERDMRELIGVRKQVANQYMSTQERQQWDTAKEIAPLVDRLASTIEKAGLQDDNAYVFSNRSALMNALRMAGAKAGVEPDKLTAELQRDAAAIKTIGAGTWARILGRSRYTYDDIVLHLPKPTDTPGRMYENVNWFRDALLMDIRSSFTGMIPPGSGQPLGPPDINAKTGAEIMAATAMPAEPPPAGEGAPPPPTGEPAAPLDENSKKWMRAHGFPVPGEQ